MRIHVERVIGQLRKKYTILRNTLPVSLIKCPSDCDKTNCTIDRILTVTAALTNLHVSPAIIPPKSRVKHAVVRNIFATYF